MKEEFVATVFSLEELNETAKNLLTFFKDEKHFLFYGEMGSGKTTFIKEICKQLGSVDNFSSPTYSIVNEYKFSEGKMFHFDLYRIKVVEELYDLGIEEYLNSNSYCFIEWPEMVESLMDNSYVKVEIKSEKNIRYFRAVKF